MYYIFGFMINLLLFGASMFGYCIIFIKCSLLDFILFKVTNI